MKFASDNNMAPVGKGTSTRPYSYQQECNGQIAHSSRIDDILLCPTLQKAINEGAKEHLEAYETVSIPGGHFDHRPIHVRIPTNAIHLWDPTTAEPPQTPSDDAGPARWRDVVLPIPAAVLRTAQAQIEATLTCDMCALQSYIREAVGDIESALANHNAHPEANMHGNGHDDPPALHREHPTSRCRSRGSQATNNAEQGHGYPSQSVPEETPHNRQNPPETNGQQGYPPTAQGTREAKKRTAI